MTYATWALLLAAVLVALGVVGWAAQRPRAVPRRPEDERAELRRRSDRLLRAVEQLQHMEGR